MVTQVKAGNIILLFLVSATIRRNHFRESYPKFLIHFVHLVLCYNSPLTLPSPNLPRNANASIDQNFFCFSVGLWFPIYHCHQFDVTSCDRCHSFDASFDLQEDHVLPCGPCRGDLVGRRPPSSDPSCKANDMLKFPNNDGLTSI